MAAAMTLDAAPAADVQLSPLAGPQHEGKEPDMDLMLQQRRSSDGETVDQALELQAEHDNLNQQAMESDRVLGLEKYNTAMPVGLRALHKELAAFQTGTFKSMWRGSAYYISKDKLLLLTTIMLVLVSTVYTFWAPQWIAVSIRMVFQDGDGSMPFADFCGWLFLYVATLALLWSGAASLLYVLYSRFVQRMRYHFATLGERLYGHDSQIADSLFLERVEGDVPDAAAFWFKTVPTAGIAVISVLLGFGMIFSHSWEVGMTALGLFAAFMVLSVMVDEVALRDAHVSAEEKNREDALWAKLHDHTTTPKERKDCLMQINRIRALRASHGSHGLMHVLVGVLYRILAFCTPVVLFLVAGRNVIDSSMSQHQVIVVSVYFAYVVMCAFMLNGVIMHAASRVGAGVKLMGFVNETHAGLASRRRSRVQDALGGPAADRENLELRMATPWGVVLLALVFMGVTLGVTLVLMENSAASQCPVIEYTCFLSMQDISWQGTSVNTVGQHFDLAQGCAMDRTPDELLNDCATSLMVTAPHNMGAQLSKVALTLSTWTGMVRTYSKSMSLPTPNDNLFNTNPVPEAEIVDLSFGQVTNYQMLLPCDYLPCGSWPVYRGDCFPMVNDPFFRCECFEGWYGFTCEYTYDPNLPEEGMENTTNAIGEVHRYRQCLNESLEFEPEIEELCNNMTVAVEASEDAVFQLVEVYWWSYKHDDEMRNKQAAKYRKYYENELAAHEAEQKAEAVHERRTRSCQRTRDMLCLISNNPAHCQGQLAQLHEIVCDLVQKWLVPSPEEVCARDCPSHWECEIRGITCYDCPRAVCTRPRDQNVMLPGYRPTFNDRGLRAPHSIVNVGGNASYVVDEFWGTTFANIAQHLLEPRYLAYMCGDLFPQLEVSFPQPLRVVKFAVNGWGDETFLRPPTFWTVDGTNDAPGTTRTWTEIGVATPENWLTNEAHLGYPFEESKVVQATNPGAYQYYRLNVRCDGLAQGLLVENWALFISGDDPMVDQAFDDEA